MKPLASIAVALGLGAAACIATDGFCPCGADPNDPLSVHDQLFSGEHLVANECVCQCGEDPVTATAKDDGECPDDGEPCVDELGQEHELDCY